MTVVTTSSILAWCGAMELERDVSDVQKWYGQPNIRDWGCGRQLMLTRSPPVRSCLQLQLSPPAILMDEPHFLLHFMLIWT